MLYYDEFTEIELAIMKHNKDLYSGNYVGLITLSYKLTDEEISFYYDKGYIIKLIDINNDLFNYNIRIDRTMLDYILDIISRDVWIKSYILKILPNPAFMESLRNQYISLNITITEYMYSDYLWDELEESLSKLTFEERVEYKYVVRITNEKHTRANLKGIK